MRRCVQTFGLYCTCSPVYLKPWYDFLLGMRKCFYCFLLLFDSKKKLCKIHPAQDYKVIFTCDIRGNIYNYKYGETTYNLWGQFSLNKQKWLQQLT